MLMIFTWLMAMLAGPQLLGFAVWRLLHARLPRVARPVGVVLPPLAFLAFSIAVWSSDAAATAGAPARPLWGWNGLGLTTTLAGVALNTAVAMALHAGEPAGPETSAKA